MQGLLGWPRYLLRLRPAYVLAPPGRGAPVGVRARGRAKGGLV